MEGDQSKYQSGWGGVIAGTLGFPLFELFGELWRVGRSLMRGFSSEGVYEVLDYECRLELQDKNGKRATVQKRERVRYLQDYITTYQDQAWGDGKILIDYRCSPGVPVDEYQLGHKTYTLISLRGFKNRGEIDEFNTQWKMRNGFLKKTGFWGTAINHRTKKITIKVIFPKDRPPLRFLVFESNAQRTQNLGADAQEKLPDGRPVIVWQKANPRLYEDYILKWEW
jgi:hypothetical protein